ncbi:glycerol-3-phosphate 1-O-acyltransferase PlsY [Anaerofilum sp. BX8]|uniref:Glycerol-3-phosphate acyltransferase n=1 Tax=Anaerofilum hominis TaxID=2763016 RepID=A0A923I954_9FIRM|nr:glycerol-3-phosphate 1-O-acyltransferase PlsY [Anaerofilum hominis]MBC5582154.1 glycerol-3-phosphate 1-O-acyltransferase PlsY [Anaerofilum hominis]
MLFLAAVLSALCAYLLGSLNFAIIVSRLFFHKDIRQFGSGNAGMTNILRTFGKGAAAGVLCGDVLKGTCAVLLGKLFFSLLAPGAGVIYGAYLAAIAAVLGHLFPLYFGFKGGKGISVATGAVLAIEPPIILALVVVFLAMVICTRIVSLSSITVAALYPVFTFVYFTFWGDGSSLPWVNTLFAAVIGALIIYMHRANIQRLRNGTEYKFGQKKENEK